MNLKALLFLTIISRARQTRPIGKPLIRSI